MDTQLRNYMNGLLVAVSVLVGAVLTDLVLPTTGEAVNTGSVVGSTLLFAGIVGGAVYLFALRRGVDGSEDSRETPGARPDR